MIIDGRAIAEEVLATLARERASLPSVIKLGVVMAGESAATKTFVRIKERTAERLRVVVVRDELPSSAGTADAVAAVERLARSCDGVIVQLPLPPEIDADAALKAIPKAKDIDAVNPAISDGERLVMAPVAGAVAEILSRAHIDARGLQAAVVGSGRLVGKPAAHLLRALGAEVQTFSSGDALDALRSADIIVSGAGKPGIITPAFLKGGAVLIDAGTSESEGRVVGDADPACADACAIFTPVPGGVGPIAVAMIFKNLFALVRREGRPPAEH